MMNSPATALPATRAMARLPPRGAPDSAPALITAEASRPSRDCWRVNHILNSIHAESQRFMMAFQHHVCCVGYRVHDGFRNKAGYQAAPQPRAGGRLPYRIEEDSHGLDRPRLCRPALQSAACRRSDAARPEQGRCGRRRLGQVCELCRLRRVHAGLARRNAVACSSPMARCG